MPQFDKLLVLDLDETLIYSTETRLDRAPDFTVDRYFTYKRPGLDRFLEECQALFRVGVWTSSSADYAHAIVNRIFKTGPEFVWTCSRCTRRHDPETDGYYFIKDLKKLTRYGYPLEKIIIVDDSREKVQRNYGNAVIVESYTGAREDTELTLLLKYIRYLGPLENIRTINKQDWKVKAKDLSDFE